MDYTNSPKLREHEAAMEHYQRLKEANFLIEESDDIFKALELLHP